jgi:hypothetical protein
MLTMPSSSPACQGHRPGPEQSVEQVQSALTANGNRILDFEAPALDWTVAQGTTSAPTTSTTHTHGSLFLASQLTAGWPDFSLRNLPQRAVKCDRNLSH